MANLTNTMICWDYAGKVGLVPWPDERGLSDEYEMSHGACWFHVQELSFEQRKCLAFIEATILIVRDKCDPQAVHQAFLGLEEYAHGLPDEMLPKELLRIRREDDE